MENNVFKHFFNIGFGTVINVLLGFITTPYITRMVNPDVYGQLTMFDTYAGILLSVLYFGLDYALIRFFYDNAADDNKRSLFLFCIIVPSIAAIIVFLILYFILKLGFINTRFTTLTYVFLFANVVSSIWQKLSTSLLRLTHQTKQYSLSVIVQKIVYCVAIFAGFILISNYQLEILIVSTIVSFVSATVIAYIFTKKYWNIANLDLSLVNKKDVFRYGLPLIVFAITLTLLDSVDKLFIDYYCSEYEVGLYSSAFTLISMMSLIQTTFNTTWIPIQTEQFVNNPNDSSFIQKGNKYITIIMYFIGINLIMFKDIFSYLLGESYRASAIYMPFLIIASIMYTVSDSTCCGIDKSKKSYLNIIVTAVPCLTSVIFLMLLVPYFGAKGAALARALSAIVYFSTRTYLSNKYYYVDYDLKKYFLITSIVLIFAFEVTFIENIALTILLYVLITSVFFIIYYKDFKEFIRFIRDSLLFKKQ